MIRSFITIVIIVLSAAGVAAQKADTLNIINHITADSVNTIKQPEKLTKLLGKSAATAPVESAKQKADDQAEADKAPAAGKNKVAGFRVQVFSDNNQRTAKNEARAKARNIAEQFPQWRTYVIYNSPYWRLKVGDFRTQREADEAVEEIKRAFPSYGKEIRVVRDRINF